MRMTARSREGREEKERSGGALGGDLWDGGSACCRLKGWDGDGRGRRRVWDLEYIVSNYTGSKSGAVVDLLGLSSSPRTVKSPSMESSSGSVGFLFARTPTSIVEVRWELVWLPFHVFDGDGAWE